MQRLILVTAIALLSTVVLTPKAEAGGGFGSVTVKEITDNSITIDWSDPTGKLRYPTSPPFFQICYKESGAWTGSCSGGEVEYSNHKPYEIKDLRPDTLYKIKVLSFTEKKSFGKWRNPRFRKAATLTQSTARTPVPAMAHGSLEFLGGTASAATVRVSWSRPTDFDLIRVCYKKTWSTARLELVCEGRNLPIFEWAVSDANRGWVDSTSIQPQIPVELEGLARCRQYSFVAYGFGPQVNGGTKIGEVTGHVGVACKTDLITDLVDDFDIVATEYAESVEAFYGRPLVDHILETNPDLGREHHALQTEGENLSAPLYLLEYLTEAHADVVRAWQQEGELHRSGLSVEQFLDREHPDVLAVLKEDRREAPGPELPPEPPLCSDFDDGTVQGWQNRHVTFSVEPREEDPLDRFLLVTDLPGSTPSLVVSSQAYAGDWIEFLPESCGEICFDVRVFDDGLSNTAAPFQPRITLFSQQDPTVNATFRSNLTIDETSGEWVTVCAPLASDLPTSAEGTWSTSPAAPATWTEVLTDVGGIRLPIELGTGSETIGYDNVCLQRAEACPSCLDPRDEAVLCTVDGTGDFVYRFRFENRHGHDAYHLFVLDLPAGVTATPDHFDLVKELGGPLADGEVSDELEVRFSGTAGLEEIPFRFSLHDQPVEECCGLEHSIELPKCDCAQVVDGSASCTLLLGPKGSGEQISYNLQLQNLSTSPEVSYILVTSQDGAVDLVQETEIEPALGFGDSVNLSLPITNASSELPDGDLCFQVSTHDSALEECCSIQQCVASPKPCHPTIYTPIGGAAFCPTEEPIDYYWRLSQVGSSGDDGVALDFGSVDGFRVTWRDLRESASPRDGAFLRFNATGSVAGESGRELGEMRVTDVGQALEITADYSALGSATKRLELYRGGELVEVIEGFQGDTIGRAPDWPRGCGKQLVVIDGLQTWCYWPEWSQPFRFEIPGHPAVTIDSIRVIAESPGEALGSIESFRLQAADIDPLDLIGIEVVPGPPDGDASGVSLDTGHDETAGTELPGGAVDDDWRIVETGEPARVVERPVGPWRDEFQSAAWISVEAGRGESVPGQRFTTYERCFCLGPTAEPVDLALDLRADDRATVRLNGLELGGPGGRFNAPNPLNVSVTGSVGDGVFLAGENCIDVEVDDSGGIVTGLLVQGMVQGADESCLP